MVIWKASEFEPTFISTFNKLRNIPHTCKRDQEKGRVQRDRITIVTQVQSPEREHQLEGNISGKDFWICLMSN